MPTAVEYKPAEDNHVPAVQNGKVNPGPIQNPSAGPGPIQGFTGGVKPASFIGGVAVAIIAMVLIGLLFFLFAPPNMVMSLWGCKPAAAGEVNGGVDPGVGATTDGAKSSPALLRKLGAFRAGIGSSDLLVGSCGNVKDANPDLERFVSPTPTYFIGGPNETQVPADEITPTAGPNPPPACTPDPNDGVCSACENTDLDSNACVCNNDGVCGPQEGFNCGDCMPEPPPDDGGPKKPPCNDPAGCP